MLESSLQAINLVLQPILLTGELVKLSSLCSCILLSGRRMRRHACELCFEGLLLAQQAMVVSMLRGRRRARGGKPSSHVAQLRLCVVNLLLEICAMRFYRPKLQLKRGIIRRRLLLTYLGRLDATIRGARAQILRLL